MSRGHVGPTTVFESLVSSNFAALVRAVRAMNAMENARAEVIHATAKRFTLTPSRID